MSNPHEILEVLREDESKMDNLLSRLEAFSKNAYSGRYRSIFEDLYVDVLTAKDAILYTFQDGFQLSDLSDAFVAAAPVLREIWNDVISLENTNYVDSDEREAFLRDLVIFIYYEIEPEIKTPGWIKFFFRMGLKLWIAGKIAKYLKYAFDFINGKVDATVSSSFVKKVRKFVDAIM